MVISKLALPRRTFLRGVGTALALPLLDAAVAILAEMATFGDAGVSDTGR